MRKRTNIDLGTFSMIESVHLQKLVDRELDIFIPEGGESHLGFLPIGEQGWYHGFSSELGNPHGLGVICHLENKIDRGLFKVKIENCNECSNLST